jgi:polyisoprenoid-binding protein YceI
MNTSLEQQRNGCRRIVPVVLGSLLIIAGFFSMARAEVLHFRVDPDASEISAAVEEPMSAIRGSAVGTFRIISGGVYGDAANVTATGRVTIVIDAASYHSSSSFRDRAVKGGVLETDRYPEITFASTSVEDVAMTANQDGTATVAGNLTLHGTSRPLRVSVKASIDSAGRLIADGEVSFRYDEWGVNPPTLLFGSMAAGNVATVKCHIVAVRAP